MKTRRSKGRMIRESCRSAKIYFFSCDVTSSSPRLFYNLQALRHSIVERNLCVESQFGNFFFLSSVCCALVLFTSVQLQPLENEDGRREGIKNNCITHSSYTPADIVDYYYYQTVLATISTNNSANTTIFSIPTTLLFILCVCHCPSSAKWQSRRVDCNLHLEGKNIYCIKNAYLT